jgi:hypothetical protein
MTTPQDAETLLAAEDCLKNTRIGKQPSFTGTRGQVVSSWIRSPARIVVRSFMPLPKDTSAITASDADKAKGQKP